MKRNTIVNSHWNRSGVNLNVEEELSGKGKFLIYL